MTQVREASSPRIGSVRERRWMLFVLAATYTSNYVDRSILNIAGEAVRADLKLSDFQLGLLGGLAFALMNGLAAIPIAWVAERTNRVRLVAAALAAWSIATAACGLAQNFWHMFVGRMFVGVTEAASPPSSMSIISDYFPAIERARAISILYIGAPTGILLGSFFCGLLIEQVGWRIAFAAIGLPGVILAIIMVLTVREPARGESDKVVDTGPTPTIMETLKTLFERPAYRHLLAAATILAFAALGIAQFLHPFLVRNYTIGYAEAASVFGLVKGAAAIVGGLVGGYVSTHLAKRDPRYFVWVPGFGMILAAPLYIAAFIQTNWMVCSFLLLLASMAHATYYGPFFASVHAICAPRMRTMATAISGAALNGIGVTAGPLFIGFISDKFATAAFASGDYSAICVRGGGAGFEASCRTAAAHGVFMGLAIGALLFLWAAFHYYMASRTFKRDMHFE